MLKKYKSIPVYQKMLVLVIIMLLLFYLVSMVVTYLGKRIVEDQYVESVISKADFYGDLVDNSIYNIRRYQLQLFSNSDVEKLRFLGNQVSGFEEIKLVEGIREQLHILNGSSDLIVTNELAIRTYDRVLSFHKGWEMDQGRKWRILEGLFDEDKTNDVIISDDYLRLIAMDNGEEIISTVTLSASKLLDDLSMIIEGSKDAGILLVNPDTKEYLVPEKQKDVKIWNKILKNRTAMPETNTLSSFLVENNKETYMVTKSEIAYLNMELYTYINQKELTEKLSNLNIGNLVLTAILLLIAISFSWSINKMIHQPLKKLVTLFKGYQNHSDVKKLPVREEGEFTYLYSSFNDMAERLDQSIKDNYEQKLTLQQSELKQLQSQINPHFLYNSFYNIYRLSKMEDFEQVATLSQKLASYYQFITKNSEDQVGFAKEFKHALDYCNIQKIRFSNRFSFEVPIIQEEIKNILVPRLILQPIIENAFNHAFEHSPNGLLKLEANYKEDWLYIFIEDNGTELSEEQLATIQFNLAHPEEVKETTGLYNVNNRLKIKYGIESGLFASRSDLGGLKIVMKINYKGRY